jgi:DNA-binding NarL/FixJ family response regulator
MEKIKVLLVDDHPFFLDGLKNDLYEDGRFEIIGLAKSYHEAFRLIQENGFDIAITDLHFKNSELQGDELIKQISRSYPGKKIIAFTEYPTKQNIKVVEKNGAHAIVDKACNNDELMKVIDIVLNNQPGFHIMNSKNKLTKSDFDTELDFAADDVSLSFLQISDREKEVLKCMAKDMSIKEISEKLNISERTVTTHGTNLRKKFNVKTTAGLIKTAISMGYV